MDRKHIDQSLALEQWFKSQEIPLCEAIVTMGLLSATIIAMSARGDEEKLLKQIELYEMAFKLSAANEFVRAKAEAR